MKSGLIGAEIDSSINAVAGCSAGYLVTIRNCTIESGVTIGYDGKQSQIGSFAGRMIGTIENCTSHATVQGVDYVGGIIGTQDNAMSGCIVSGCTCNGTVKAGGIMGGGYSDSSAPNGIHTTIKNCVSTGSITGADCVGGILGGDPYVAQAWNAYEFTGNKFAGSVNAASGTYVGGIIGFYDSLNKFDNITNNFTYPPAQIRALDL